MKRQQKREVEYETLKNCQNIIDETKGEGLENVTNIIIESNIREQKRRQQEKSNQEERYLKVEQQLKASREATEKINNQWDKIIMMDVPENLQEMMKKFDVECKQTLSAKNHLIQELRNELKQKDGQYVATTIKQQEDDVKAMIERMHLEFMKMYDCYSQQLKIIESSYIEEQQKIFNESKTKIDDLFDKRRSLELKIMDNKISREEQFQQKLDEKREHDNEHYNNLKMNLENNIQLLEQQLEEMRSIYDTNREKLDYNFKVLEQRVHEDQETLNHQNSKLTRLKEKLNNEKKKYSEMDSFFKNENNDLTEMYKRVTELFKDLQRKFRLFEDVDQKKYQEVWNLNENSVRENINKVLAADKLIHEQVLGINYQPPSPHYFKFDDDNPKDTMTPINYTPREIDNSNKKRVHRFTTNQIKIVLTMIANDVDYLVENKSQDHNNLTKDEIIMFKVDSIFKQLGIDDMEDVEQLVSLFFSDPPGPEPIVSSTQTNQVLLQFIKNRQIKRTETIEVKDDLIHEKQIKQKEKENAFWNRLASPLTPSTLRLWNALEKGLQDYLNVLEERSKLAKHNEDIKKQNLELKKLIRNYLSSDINEKLAVPPSKTISL